MNKINESKPKKLIIIIVIVMLCNFVMPNYALAMDGGVIFKYGVPILLMVPDLLIQKLQQIFIDEDSDIALKDPEGGVSNYSILYSAGVIFSGKVPGLDVNFISPMGKNGVVNLKRNVYKYTQVGNRGQYDYEDLVNQYGLKTGEENEGVNMSDAATFLFWFGKDVAYITWENENDGQTYWYHVSSTTNLPVIMYLVEGALIIGGVLAAPWTGGSSLAVSGFGLKMLAGTVLTDAAIQNMSEFFSGGTLYKIIKDKTETSTRISIAYSLRNTVATYYKVFQEVALVILLSVLVYVAIRIILASSSKDKAKYKQMLGHWFAAICILFLLHFFMSIVLTSIQAINDVFANSVVKNGADILMSEIRNSIGYDPNNEDLSGVFAGIIIYLVLVIYTIQFTIVYLKRVINMAFLTMIAPMVAFTYPIDKMKDGKAQALALWLKEFSFNALMQPIHMILYYVFVHGAISIVKDERIYALVMIGFLKPGEKFVRKIFGLEEDSSLGKMASALGGAAIMNSINKMGSKGPKQKGGETKESNSNIRTANHPGNSGISPDGLGNEPGSKWDGAKNVAKKYVFNKENGKKLVRGAGKVAGAGVLGTAGLAAGIATGERENAGAGATGGIAAGSRFGGNLVDGGANLISSASSGIQGIKDAYGAGKYGQEAYAKMQQNEAFRNSADYSKLTSKYPGQEGDIEAFLNAGVTDAGKMGTAMQSIKAGKYNAQQAIQYMKMAEQCPAEILYDKENFKTFVTTLGMPESEVEKLRKGIADFK